MKITVLTIFPEYFDSLLNMPLVKRAVERKLLELHIVDIKDFAEGSFRHIDDSPFGGGVGMILKCQPVFDALYSVKKENSHLLYLTPIGKPYTQKKARELLKEEELIILCGHYEGVDCRIEEAFEDKISIGDYILSGGEIPAMAIVDSLVRMLGTIRKESTINESFEEGLLEHPQYTKPRSYNGQDVPEVLLSGHQENIRKWKLKESLRRTLKYRPDLLENI
ncbi:MAG: tRNA (guanosine(37)-N1)-methyltransferase TrmD, partial [Sphaerochaetaceae bacterium]|nr:tRNA (guanosine(37)-N1)-methyltransferase TrmD [Sphaerochaetaceae bacterium]